MGSASAASLVNPNCRAAIVPSAPTKNVIGIDRTPKASATARSSSTACGQVAFISRTKARESAGISRNVTPMTAS